MCHLLLCFTLRAGQLHAHSGKFADAGLEAAAHITGVLEGRLYLVTVMLQELEGGR